MIRCIRLNSWTSIRHTNSESDVFSTPALLRRKTKRGWDIRTWRATEHPVHWINSHTFRIARSVHPISSRRSRYIATILSGTRSSRHRAVGFQAPKPVNVCDLPAPPNRSALWSRSAPHVSECAHCVPRSKADGDLFALGRRQESQLPSRHDRSMRAQANLHPHTVKKNNLT